MYRLGLLVTVVAHEVARPMLADELAVGHQAVYAVLAEEPDRAHGLCLDKRLQQQSHQFAARQVHRLSQMLLHDWKKFANFASVLGISSFLHLKNWKFFFAKSLILKGLCNSCVLDN